MQSCLCMRQHVLRQMQKQKGSLRTASTGLLQRDHASLHTDTACDAYTSPRPYPDFAPSMTRAAADPPSAPRERPRDSIDDPHPFPILRIPQRPMRAKKTKKSDKPQELLREHAYILRHVTQPGDYARENTAFWKWKRQLSRTWAMAEASQLPLADIQSRLLRQMLEEEARGSSEDGLRKIWLDVPPEKRRSLWPHLMQSTLRSVPARAADVFAATFDASLLPSYLVQDTLLHLARLLAAPATLATPATPATAVTAERLSGLLRQVLENSPPNYLRLRQSTIFFFIQSLQQPEAICDLYRLLTAYGHPLHKNTRLQMASRIAKSATFKMSAVDMLQAALTSTDLDINTPQGAALCTAILSVGEDKTPKKTAQPATVLAGLGGHEHKHSGHDHEQTVLTPAEVFEHLLRCGLEPNYITYTTIIRGLCLRGELEAAQQVVQLMIRTQIEPDAYVYSTMLNGAKHRGDVAMVCQIAETAAAHGIQHAVVWNDFLQAIYAAAFAEARRSPDIKRPRVVPAFPLMLQAYTKTFSLEPLRALLPDMILQPPSQQPDGSSGDDNRWEFFAHMAPSVHALDRFHAEAGRRLLPPTSTTLATMILGYIQGLSSPYDVIAFYSNFRRLLQAGDGVATELVRDQHTLVHDIVVMALCEFEGMLRVALDVVSDMLRDATTEMAAPAPATEHPEQKQGHQEQKHQAAHHPAPSVYTWSILLNGFMFHRQTKQGEHILRMMRERGVQPNIVTWNTLMAGYARLQNVRKTAKALQRLEAEGFEPDDFTLRAFSYLRDKASVLRHMEQRRAAKASRAEAATPATPASKADGADEADPARPSNIVHLETRDSQANPAAMPDGGDEDSRRQTAGQKDRHHSADNTIYKSRGARHPRHTARSARWPNETEARELRQLESEVEEIAKMMDEEQREGHGRGQREPREQTEPREQRE